MTIQNRYLISNVSTGNSNVGILSGNTVALLGASVCNKSNVTVGVNLWVDPLIGANAYYLFNTPISSNSTIAVFGGDMKHFVLNGDVLWISSNVPNSIDFILSTAEGV